MKRLLSTILIICVVSFAFAGCVSGMGGDNDYIIKVSGTTGLNFSGSYMTVTSNGNSTSKTVDGTVPTQYSVRGTIVSVVFQKKTEGGYLKVEVLRGGKVINSSDTTAAYGVVSVATQ